MLDVPWAHELFLGQGLAWSLVGSDGILLPFMRDPAGHRAPLADWDIDVDGVVTPSVLCVSCGFHDNVRLTGWREHGIRR